MEISNNIQEYKSDIIKIAYENYMRELAHFDYLPIKLFESFTQYMHDNMDGINGLVYLEEGMCTAYFLYHIWEEGAELFCRIPEWGYGTVGQKREKAIGYLFQTLAEHIVKDKTVNFSVHLYAHDTEMQRLFSYMEFGTQAETGICRLKKAVDASEVRTRELSKEELVSRWKEIWPLLEQLINHLKMSPVFYPGEEFTEEVYKDFFADAGTRVFVAEEEDKIIGLIEANMDNIPLLFAETEAANVGEAYVSPEYRGKGISQALLIHAKQELVKSNYKYAWVEHGTANPNARYFWNKYFDTYKYEMIRRIDR